jgi:metal-sulfur cluster biosynthetic enzyme
MDMRVDYQGTVVIINVLVPTSSCINEYLNIVEYFVFSMVTVDQVLTSLKKVVDPELHKDIVSMGMIKDLDINNNKVSFTLELTTPACPFNSEIEQDVRNTIANLGVADLDLRVTARVMEGRAI